MSLSVINSVKSKITVLPQLAQELNYLFIKYDDKSALKNAHELMANYYKNQNYDWCEWGDYSGIHAKYSRQHIPINNLRYTPGSALGYKYIANNTPAREYPFQMYLLTWLPGQSTDIHYHRENGCLFMCLQGQINEVRYRLDPFKSRIKPSGCKTIRTGNIVYIDNTLGAHKIINAHSSVARSLHIYSPSVNSKINAEYSVDYLVDKSVDISSVANNKDSI